MKAFNKTIIIGRLGSNPELKSTPKGDIANFMLAQTTCNNGIEEVTFHHITAVGNQARLCVEHLHEGDLCCIEGQLKMPSYKKDYRDRVIVAEHITFLACKRSNNHEAEDSAIVTK